MCSLRENESFIYSKFSTFRLQTEAARRQGRTPISSNLAAAWRKWAVILKTVHPSGISATELRHVAQIAALCEIRLLDLFCPDDPTDRSTGPNCGTSRAPTTAKFSSFVYVPSR